MKEISVLVWRREVTHRLVRHRDFSLQSAKATIWYSLEKKVKKLFGGHKWVTVTYPMWNGQGVSHVKTSGDLEWAKRIAKEYKIKLPEAE